MSGDAVLQVPLFLPLFLTSVLICPIKKLIRGERICDARN